MYYLENKKETDKDEFERWLSAAMGKLIDEGLDKASSMIKNEADKKTISRHLRSLWEAAIDSGIDFSITKKILALIAHQ
jgi:hypothetical protein